MRNDIEAGSETTLLCPCVTGINDKDDTEVVKTYLHEAVLEGNVDKLKDLLKDSNCKTPINDFYKDDSEVNKQHQVLKTLLYIAAEKGHKECLLQLIENGADVNKRSSHNKTPLYIAAEKGNRDCLITLLENGANKDKGGPCGTTPAFVAALKKRRNCLIELIKRDASVKRSNTVFESIEVAEVLHDAVKDGKVATLEDNKIALSYIIGNRDETGKTLFHLAVENNQKECLDLLIKLALKEPRTKTSKNNTDEPNESGHTEEATKNRETNSKDTTIESSKNNIDEVKAAGHIEEATKKRETTSKDTRTEISEDNNDVLKASSQTEEKTSNSNNHQINKPNVYGHTPLFIAALLKNDCYALLKDHVSNFNSALYSCAVEGEKECLTSFLHEGFEGIDLSYKGYKRCLKKNDGGDDEDCCLKCVRYTMEKCSCCDEENVSNGEDATQCLKCFIEEDEELPKCFVKEDKKQQKCEQQECVCEFHDNDDAYFGSFAEKIFHNVSEPVDFINDVFNSQSVDIEKSKNGEKIYKANFKIFLPKEKQDQGQMHVFSCLLNAMNSEEEVGVLNHIYCDIFLDAKLWTKTLFCILFIRLLMWYGYFICVLFYTAIVINIFKFSLNHELIISATSIFLIIRFLMQMNQIRLLWNDRDSRIYSKWTIVKCVLVMGSVMFTIFYLIITVSLNNNNIMISETELSTLKSLSAIVIVILHNIEFILIHLKFNVVSKYYTMFLTVLYKTLKAIGFLFLPILCFIIIFHIQFSHYSEFNRIDRTIIKTLVLMTGEFEYENTLSNNLQNATNEQDTSRNLQNLYVRFIFLVFIILINVVLLNLIVGISVDNVAKAKKTGNAVSIRQKAEFCIQVEEFLQFMKNSRIECIRNMAIYLDKQSKVDSIYEMKRSYFALLRQNKFDAMDELVRNTNILKKQKKLSTLFYISGSRANETENDNSAPNT